MQRNQVQHCTPIARASSFQHVEGRGDTSGPPALFSTAFYSFFLTTLPYGPFGRLGLQKDPGSQITCLDW